jgi:hypothetical protein
MLPDIGYVIVDGPAEFDMLDPMRARLTKGRVRMRVSKTTGHGFVIETPYGNVTDLGTEFGLNVPEHGNAAGLVVFDGEVDLQVKQAAEPQELTGAYRLAQGEGVTFNHWGQLAPIGSIVTGTVATFLQAGETVGDELPPLIASVNDNQRQSGKIKFYEIVPGGLAEDAKRYVDRPHEWNGVTSDGIPAYLQGADYVRTFGHDGSSKNLEIYVTLTAPAKLYVLLDDRTQPPEWLKKDFRDTGDKIGADAGPWGAVNRTSNLGVGAGNSIDFSCTVWERIVSKAEVVTLGSSVPKGTKPHHAMYGIAAVPLETEKASNSEAAISRSDSKSE